MGIVAESGPSHPTEVAMPRIFPRIFLPSLLIVILVTACGIAATPSGQPAALPTRSAPAQNTTVPNAGVVPSSTTQPASGPAAAVVSFRQDILPIFETSCIKCHGGDKTEKGLDVKTYAALMAGSQKGTVVVPGDPAGSSLAKLLLNGKMPKRGPKLTPEQVQMVVDWIQAGAPNN